MVKYLVEHGADVNQSFINQETGERQTLLQIASESPSEDILCYLKEVICRKGVRSNKLFAVRGKILCRHVQINNVGGIWI